jgi:hypothetical protein
VAGQLTSGEPCIFTPTDAEGSFTVSFDEDKYFAYVVWGADGEADGFWNSEPFADKAQTPLGVLLRDGACWQNAMARVCAE